MERSAARCLYDIYNVTKHKELATGLSVRTDVGQKQTYVYDNERDGFYSNHEFQIFAQGDGLSKEEIEELKNKTVTDILLYLYELTTDQSIACMLQMRKDVEQIERRYVLEDGKCKTFYKFEKVNLLL